MLTLSIALAAAAAFSQLIEWRVVRDATRYASKRGGRDRLQLVSPR